jgi:4-aminobutyrate aminotransferase (EC 2.6.1.19)
LRKIADNINTLVDDEVQSGIARTGKWFAIENWNVVPDIIAMAKAIGGGLPLGAIVAKSEVMDTMKKGSHANTFGGNPIALAAMEAVIDTIKEEKLAERASKLGDMVLRYFNDLKEELEIIGDVRGKGLMIGVELVRNKKTKEPASKELGRILDKSFKRGVLVIGSGVSSIRIAPPLVIEEDLLAKAIEIVGDILKEENSNL